MVQSIVAKQFPRNNNFVATTFSFWAAGLRDGPGGGVIFATVLPPDTRSFSLVANVLRRIIIRVAHYGILSYIVS
jgi:hypothetical protein